MDAYEATKVVFSRIQSLDPENASKIMGLLLIQDHGEKEMIRLAFGPENLLHSVVVKARQELGIPPNTPSTPSTPPSPFLSNSSNPLSLSRQNSITANTTTTTTTIAGGVTSTTTSSRFLPSSLKIPTSLSLSSLASPSSASSPASNWGVASAFPDFQSPEDHLVSSNTSSNSANGVMNSTTSNSSRLNPWTPPFYRGGGDLMDEIQLQLQLQEEQHQLYYPQGELGSGAAAHGLSGNGGGDSIILNGNGVSPPTNWGGVNNLAAHRRSCSVSDINLGLGSFLDDPASGLGWKPCLYYAKGFCKNGSSCKFVHDADAAAALIGSPSKLEMMEQCHELLRSKSMQHQKLMAAMASSPGSPTFPFKGLSLFAQQQQNDSPRAAAALMMGEDLHKFSRSRLDNGRADSNPASRQIYLTFPADSTFREEDVSNYFSIYGPVQDVRIPYQQKRMFGFVTFVYPETVKIILAKGNPHFVCDARVLVKPYKEKGKVPDKFRKQQQQQQMERGDFAACNSPTALDSRDPFDIQLGARMAYDTQYMLWRRKLEQEADLQQALELQNRRLMGLSLLDVKRNQHHHHRSLSTGAPIPSPTQSPNSIFNQPLLGSDPSSPDAPDENCASPPLNDAKQALQQAINDATDKEKESSLGKDGNNNSKGKEGPCLEDHNLPESFEHNLPDSPFASPTKGASKYMTAFSGSGEMENTAITATTSVNNNSRASAFSFLGPSTLDIPPFKSCYFQMPRSSPGHGAIGM